MPYRHSGRNGMRINYEVWHNSFGSEWKVFLSIQPANGPFLAKKESG
jgi:hypothetical protein